MPATLNPPIQVEERPRTTRRSTGRMAAIAVSIGLTLGLWGIGRPSPWRDEIATVAISHRSFAEIFHLGGYVDAVIVPYYLLAHTFAAGNLLGIRLISAVAFAATAGLLVWLCNLLEAPRAAGWAAAALLIAPTASRFGQEARPYALTMMLATLATCLLVRAARTQRWRPWIGYAAALVALGHFQVIAMLIVGAHGFTVLTRGRGIVIRYMLAVVGALALVAPIAWIGMRERYAVAWIPKPTLEQFERLPQFLAGAPMLVTLWIVTGIAAVSVRSFVPAAEASRQVIAVALPWALFPPVLLFLMGQMTPLYSERYLLFCLPGVALLVAVALARLPLWIAGVLTAVMILVAVPTHLEQREVTGHGENLGALLAIMDDNARPGDAIFFEPGDNRIMAEAYPRTFSDLDDITMGRGPAASGNLTGDRATPTEVTLDMAKHRRVWVIGRPHQPKHELAPQIALNTLAADFRQVQVWTAGTFTVEFYERSNS